MDDVGKLFMLLSPTEPEAEVPDPALEEPVPPALSAAKNALTSELGGLKDKLLAQSAFIEMRVVTKTHLTSANFVQTTPVPPSER